MEKRDENGHKIDDRGNLVQDEKCTFCEQEAFKKEKRKEDSHG